MESLYDKYVKLYIECGIEGLKELTNDKEVIELLDEIKFRHNSSEFRSMNEIYDELIPCFEQNDLMGKFFNFKLSKISQEYAKKNHISSRSWQLGYYFCNSYKGDYYDNYLNDLNIIENTDVLPVYIWYDIRNADDNFIKILKES